MDNFSDEPELGNNGEPIIEPMDEPEPSPEPQGFGPGDWAYDNGWERIPGSMSYKNRITGEVYK